MELKLSSFFPLLVMLQTVVGILIQDRQQNISINKQFSFPVMKHYMPHGKHLKTKRLLRKLGQDFNSEWMSIELPRLLNYVPDTFNQQITKVQSGFEKSRLEHVLVLHASNLKLDNQSKEIVKTFLQAMSKCEINFEWDDLGSLFWPRYVKSGTCASGWSCSWPPGMLCQASEIKKLRLLHWRCIRRKQVRQENKQKSKNSNITVGDKKKRKSKLRGISGAIGKTLKCRWKKISYEVTTSCSCSC